MNFSVITLALNFAAMCGPVVAQPVGVESSAWSTQLRGGFGSYFNIAVRDSAVDLDGNFYRVEARVNYRPTADWRFGLSVDALRWDADWSGAVDFGRGVGVPFDRFERRRLQGSVFHRLDANWSIVGFGGVSYSLGTGNSDFADAGWSSGRTGSVALAAIYHFNPRLSVSAGFLYRTQLEDSNQVIPILSVRYRHDDFWTIRLFEVSSIDNFDLLGVDYAVRGDDSLVLNASLQMANESFRIIRSGADALAGEDRSVRLLLGASWQVIPGLTLQPYIGYDVYRKLKFVADDVTLSSLRLENGWVAGLQVGWRF